ncbi:MAG: pilus assembly PilX N-terminal domain-containing protein, partial [Patescibacteria group bacterium]
MKNKILKNNKDKGFVLLYTMILSSIILVVALSITNIALKEAQFSTSARATNEAFFAADTGAECALFYDKFTINAFPFNTVQDVAIQMNCAGQSFVASSNTSNSWSFIVPNLGSSENGCAIVSIVKNPETTIVSKGYNNCPTG